MTAIAYVVTAYPALSNTFVQREITALESLSDKSGEHFEVLRFSVNRPSAQDLLTDVHQSEAARTTYIKGNSLSAWTVLFLRALLVLRLRLVKALIFALRDGGLDLRQVVWRFFYLCEALVVWRGCRNEQVRHLHAHFGQGSTHVAWFATLLLNDDPAVKHHVSWSFTIHGWLEFLNEEADSMRAKIEAADHTFCISDHTRSQAMRIADPGVWPRIMVQRCGVDLDRFPFSHDGSATRDEGGSCGPPIVVTVARLAPEKGHVVLFEATRLLWDSGRPIRLQLAGSGPFREELESHVRRLGLERVVEFLGPISQDDIPGLLAAATVFCLPSFSEGVPVSLMESMAVGTPVVATAINGVPELVIDGVTGRLVPAARPDALAGAIWSCCSDGDLRSRLIGAARAHVEADYDVRKNAAQLARVFQSCIAGSDVVSTTCRNSNF